MKYITTPVFVLLALCSVSCSSYLSPPSPAPVMVSAEGFRSANTRILLRTGSIRIEATDVGIASRMAQDIVKKHRGYLETINSSDDDDAYASLKLRIPKGALTRTMDELAALGRVTSRNIEVEDVTEQWIDIQAKMKNMRALRDRLRVLLRQARNVKETLEVEKELTRVQSELDSLEGKIKAMRKHSAYSRLSLTISRKSVPGPVGAVGKGAWWGVKKLFVLR